MADCKYVNKKYTTTQPLHRGEEGLRGIIHKDSEVAVVLLSISMDLRLLRVT